MEALLLGGACGDALGAPVEFQDRAAILRDYGPQGIQDFAPAYGRIGAITDDTQMTLFTVEGLVDAAERWRERGICHVPSMVHAAYYRWHQTQTGAFHAQERAGRHKGLLRCPELWSRRAPGTTCLSAFSDRSPDLGTRATNDSKGAGGIMRVAPVGLLAVEDVFDLGAETARLTHGHPTGWVASGAFALFIAALADGLDAEAAGAAMLAGVEERAGRTEIDDPAVRGFYETTRAIRFALRTPAGTADARLLASLGEGWVAEEALAMTLWVLRAPLRPLDALRMAVNITGDSDTIGTMVGQALGVMYGTAWIPPDWLDTLELRDTMIALAARAAIVPQRTWTPRPPDFVQTAFDYRAS
jgi:ADP-ribosylglycohydrolase